MSTSTAVFNLDALSSSFLKRASAKGRPLAERNVALTPEVEAAIERNAVVAIGVSGGKDSDACALSVARHLDAVGHTGPRLLIHSDLGRVEWKDSLPSCERLAARLGWELVTVRRGAGDMLARWEGRWANNVQRYVDLSCVRLILPWSTPSMRFCTSELKAQVISGALRKRYPTDYIINVTGIRRQESPNRAKMPVSQPNTLLKRKRASGLTWNAIIEYPIEDVFAEISDSGLRLHEAYTLYGTSRVSCAYCIMSSEADLQVASTCEDNVPLYVSMVELEAESGFGFQGNRWLADVAPHLLSDDLKQRVLDAKAGAARRIAAESELPKHLLYVKGWPVGMPTMEEAELIALVRRRVAAAVGLEVKHTTGEAVRERYAELLAAKARKLELTGGVFVGVQDATCEEVELEAA